MSKGSRFPTRHSELSNSVVLVGATGRLIHVANQATATASGGRLLRVDVSHAATVCAEERPYAMVVPSEVYEFGGSEFDLLARDLSMGLIVVPSTVALPVLSALLLEEAARLG